MSKTQNISSAQDVQNTEDMKTTQAIILNSQYINRIRAINSLKDDCPLRAVIYTRVSTELQPQSALKSQESTAQEFAELNNIEVVKVFSDRGISGTTYKRPQFQEMIKYSKDEKNQIQFIIVYKLDRFFRNEQLHHVYEYELRKHGVYVLSATEETYKTDMGTRILKAVTLISNEYEAVKIRQNVKRGQTYTAKQDKTNGGIAPLGYDINRDGKYIINEDEAEIIRQIFKMRHQGMTYKQIAEALNKKHYKTKLGGNFTKNSIYEILRNPKYKGVFTYGTSSSEKEPGKRPNRHKYKDESEIIKVEGAIEAIVSEELWESVQPKKNVNRKKNTGKYLLSGIVKCAVCGGIYHVDDKNGVKYLRHNSKNKTNECKNSIQMDKAERSVILRVANRIYQKKHAEYLINNFDDISKSQIKKLEKEITSLKRRISFCTTKVDGYVDRLCETDDKETRKAINNRITETHEVIKDLTSQMNSLKAKAPEKPSIDEMAASKSKLIDYMKASKNVDEAKNLIHEVVEGVYVKPDGKIEIKFRK